MAIEGGAIGVFFSVLPVVMTFVDGEDITAVDVAGGGVDIVVLVSGDDDTVVFGDTVRSNLCPYRSSCERGGGSSRMNGSSGGGGVETGVSGEDAPLLREENGDMSLTGEETSPVPCSVLESNVGDSTLYPFGDAFVNTVEIFRFFLDALSKGVIVLCLDARVGEGVFFERLA